MGDIMGIKYDKIIFWGDVQQFLTVLIYVGVVKALGTMCFWRFLSKSTKNIVHTWLGSM